MEVWEDIIGFEGHYKISNFGRVKSLSRERICKNGAIKIYKEKILRGIINNIGYLCYDLYLESGRKNIKSHFLVAFHFCDGYKIGLVVNHKDGNKLNNHYSNLEWVTFRENVLHAFKNRLMVRKGFDILDLNTGVYFESIREAYRSFNFSFSLSQLKKMINGKVTNVTSLVKT